MQPITGLRQQSRSKSTAALSGLDANATYHFRVDRDATPAAPATAPTRRSKRSPPHADGPGRGGLRRSSQTSATLDGDSQPQRRGSQRVHGRIRPDPRIRIQRVHAARRRARATAPWMSRLRSPGLQANTTYHFRVVATQRGRHRAMAAMRPSKRSPSPRPSRRARPARSSATTATLNADRQPQRRRSRGVLARIRHSRAPTGATHRAVHRQDPGAALWRPRQRSAALTPTRPTTSASRRPTPAAPATAPTKPSRRPRPRQPS